MSMKNADTGEGQSVSSTATPPPSPSGSIDATGGGSIENAAFKALIQAAAGAGGGAFSTACLYPLDLVKTRIQAGTTNSASIVAATQEILSRDGIRALFWGLDAKLSEATLRNFIYFYVYDYIRTLVLRKTEMTPTMNLLSGYVAGVINMTITVPLEVLGTKMQISTEDKSMLACARRTLAEDGFLGFFTGYKLNLFLCLNPAIQNTVFDMLKARWQELKIEGGRKKYLTPVEAFLLGAFAKCVATVLTYPLVRIKTLQQANIKQDAEKKNKNLIALLFFYFRGLNSSLLKTCLQAALMYMAKDMIANSTTVLFKQAAALIRGDEDRRHKVRVAAGRPLY